MKRLICLLLTLLLLGSCLMIPVSAEETFENTVNMDRLFDYARQMYLALEGKYDSINNSDNGAMSIGYLQWHGSNALALLKRICKADAAFSKQTLGDSLYTEVINTAATGWKSRTLGKQELPAVRTLIDSTVGRSCQDAFAREFITDEAKHGFQKHIRSDAALLYYCSLENQYGPGGVNRIMSYIRKALGISDTTPIRSLDKLHEGFHKAAPENPIEVKQYLAYRDRIYKYLTETLGLPSGDPSLIEIDSKLPFTDVPTDHWAYEGICWAYLHEPQITKGMSDTSFSPGGNLTRAQAVTFLRRAAGEPEPSMTDTVFTDIDPASYYYASVLWAIENDITNGTTETTFSPRDTLLMEYVLTFLYRANGCPEVSTSTNPFTNVDPERYYYKPVLWAYENGFLMDDTGKLADRDFDPQQSCSRATMVMYLYYVSKLSQ